MSNLMGWANVTHGFASCFKAIVKGAQYLATKIDVVEKAAPEIEQVSALIPNVGPQVVAVEQISFAALGFVAQGIHYGGAAFEQDLLNKGADQAFVDSIKAIIKQFPQVISEIEAVFGKPKPTA